MAIRNAPLNLLTFPQYWEADARIMRVRFLCFPRIDPDIPLADGLPAFTTAVLKFEARVIPNLERLPRSVDVAHVIGGAAPGSSLDLPAPVVDKASLFRALADALNVQPRALGTQVPTTTGWRILKPQTASWRSLVGNRQASPFLIDEGAVDCSFHEALAGQPKDPVKPPAVLRWGQAMALAMRNEPLARALGLIGEVSVSVPEGKLASGGWIYLGLHNESDYADHPQLVNLQAARVPPLVRSRALYAATLFPVDQDDFIADDPLSEAMAYSDGFARLVHAAQAFEEESGSGTGDGDCIRIAWDDEQVATWLNRQTDPDAGSPMGTLGYRVDVKDLTAGNDWQPLQMVASIGPLTLGGLNLGGWQGEHVIQVSPVRRMPKPSSDFWLPAYFATWRGSSLILSDADFIRLQKAASPPDAGFEPLQLDREKTFKPIVADNLKLQYGHRYAFRVRLVDLAHGGPSPTIETPISVEGGSSCTTEVLFLRHRRPGAVEVRELPSRNQPRLILAKPRLRFPELRFAGDVLKTEDADQILSGKPDPDVDNILIRLEVRPLAGERVEWQRLYEVEREFPADTITLPLSIVDIPCIVDLAQPDPANPLPIPTGRDLRLVITALGKNKKGYFADQAARQGMPTIVPLTAAARAEAPLIKLSDQPLVSYFLRAPGPEERAPRPLELLAQDLNLSCDGLTLTINHGTRTVICCGPSLRSTPAPDRSSVIFSSDADLRQRWINVMRFAIKRDWSWRGLAQSGLVIDRSAVRKGRPAEWQRLGTIEIPASVAALSLPESDAAEDHRRQATDVIYIDAVAPLIVDGAEFPAEIDLAYRISEPFPAEIVGGSRRDLLVSRLPIVTPPRQVLTLVSAGIALSPFEAATMERERHLWLEFAEPPADPGDAYFARVLAIAPDPLLAGMDADIPKVPEAPLPLEAEWLRRVVPGQSDDASGASAMPDRLTGGRDDRHVLVPLPEGLDSHSLELTGMFTYELRVGHADGRWCTAHGRWGPALRLAGVQHPPPQLRCEAVRHKDEVLVAAPFACPVYAGRSIQPQEPHTRLWALIYARVSRVDKGAFSNLLLMRAAMRANDRADLVWTLASGSKKGVGIFVRADLERELAVRGLRADTPLAALAAEFYTDPEVFDPLGADLGSARLLRTSTLVPVPDAC